MFPQWSISIPNHTNQKGQTAHPEMIHQGRKAVDTLGVFNLNPGSSAQSLSLTQLRLLVGSCSLWMKRKGATHSLATTGSFCLKGRKAGDERRCYYCCVTQTLSNSATRTAGPIPNTSWTGAQGPVSQLISRINYKENWTLLVPGAGWF